GPAGGRRRGRKGGERDGAAQGDVIADFPFIDPPDPRAIADGWQQLSELGAVDERRALTPLGRTMARLPVDVKLARMLVAARSHGCLREMLAIASFLGIQDPRERPADQRAAADAAHAQFSDPRSEFVGILRLWDAYDAAHSELTQSQLRKWCERNFLGFLRMREWRELHRQLKLQCAELWAGQAEPPPPAEPRKPASVPADAGDALAPHLYAPLHRALIAGLPTHIGHLGKRGVYEGPRGRRFQLFPGSTLARKPPPWVLTATLLDTEKVWAITNAAIEPDWAIAELPHLLAHRHHDPRWSRSQGRVLGSEQVSLFGLVLAPKRPVDYGRLYPQEARQLFLADGLVAGEVNLRAPFLARNLATLEAAREEEAKQRRAGLVVDEDWMRQWYADRIPSHIVEARTLDAWYAKADAAQRQALEWTRDDLLVGEGTDAARFPAFIPLGDARLAVSYRFEPGAPDDGMTVSVPLHLLNALDPARLSWLAPGFVADKAVALIRTLPKALRRNFVPAPDFAAAFAQAHGRDEPDAFAPSLARFLQRMTGVAVAATDFDVSALDPHLRANLRLVEVRGRGEPRVLAESRDLEELRARFGERAARAFASRAAEGLARTGLRECPGEPIPLSVPGAGGVPAYPALQDDGDSASLAVHADPAQAVRLHPEGVRRLLRIALQDRIRQARRQLPVQPKTALLYAAIEAGGERKRGGGGDRLREDLVDGALEALLADGLEEIRDPDAFATRRDSAGRALFGEAMRRLQQAEAILELVAQVRARLESRLVGWARGNLDDMQAHLASLAYPGFLREEAAQALEAYPRWLRALATRAERAQRDPL